MRRVRFMLMKEFKQIFRDKPMLALIFIVPIFQLLILSFAVSVEITKLPLLIVDMDKSLTSRSIIDAFRTAEEFDIVKTSYDLTEIKKDFQSWKIAAAVVIPRRFEKEFISGSSPQIQIALDGVDNQTANLAYGFAAGILQDYSTKLHLSKKTFFKKEVYMIERFWYNMNLSNRQYMVPGVVVILLTILPMMLSAMSLVKEKEIGTLEQLQVTPLLKSELLAGKILPLLILSYIELAVVTFVAVFVFQIQMQGSYLVLGVIALLYLIATIGLGVLSSTITETQQQAMFIAWFFMVFMVLLSGFFIPLENMPESVRAITYLNPTRYFMTVTRNVFQKGSSFSALYHQIWPLCLLSTGIFSFSLLKMKK